MQNYKLGFITDLDLFTHTKETVEKYRFKINLKKFNKNLIDPIKLTFDSKVYNKTIKDAIEAEIVRQMDKSNNNHIGYFHQNIFKYIGTGWDVPKTGYDVINLEKNYYIEMKNKHNTMNSSSSQKTYMRMQNTVLKHPESTCMLVEVIARKSQDITWKVRLDGSLCSHKNIRRVSIDKFYELVTGDRIAFKKLCEKLPLVIEDVLSGMPPEVEKNTVLSDGCCLYIM